MKRRLFLKYAFGAAIVGVSVSQITGLAQSADKRANILLIHTDQHRIECLGAYGNKQIKTPNIDTLASDGVLFNNSFCSYPVCTPSRYSLITGLYVREHGGYSNHCTLRPETDTFPAMLKKAGYKTKAIGKMHFTPTYCDLGFEEMELAEQNGPGRWDDDYHRYLRDKGLVDYNDLEDQLIEYRKKAPKSYYANSGSRESNLPDKHHSTTWIGDRAVETIKKWDKNQSNLLMVGFIKPHHPFDPPERWAEMYDPDEMDILPGWTDKCFNHDLARNKGFFPHAKQTKATIKRATAYYYASITHIDHHVGRMIDLLKQKKLYDNTMVIFTSDHGEYLGFHHMLLKGNYSYDPLAKVPLIIKYPGGTDKGKVSDDLVNNIDLAPTILKTVGLKPTSQMSGLDLSGDFTPRKVLIAENKATTIMARTHTRKLILNIDKKGKPLNGLLFDLEKDPLEMKNLYNDPTYVDDRSQLISTIQTWQTNTSRKQIYCNQEAPRINQPNVPPDLSHRKDIIEYFKKKMQRSSD
jgi:arylsulfatase